MRCRQCKNVGFVKTPALTKPVRVYHSERFPGEVMRRYHVCLQCGFKWTSVQSFERPVSGGTITLFDPPADEPAA